MKRKTRGFTIVELLIVVVIIAILATITIVSYNGIQKRATASAINSELQSNSRKVLIYLSNNGVVPTYAQLQADPDLALKVNSNYYTTLAYCNNNTDQAAFGAQTKSGDVYYGRVGQPLVQDNTVAATGACTKLGITNTDGSAALVATIVGGWTQCATENGTCSFSGIKTVRYGANNTFITKSGVTSSITCSNAAFGSDPTPGVAKSCQYQ